MLFLLKYCHPSLQEPCQGDCYLVFSHTEEWTLLGSHYWSPFICGSDIRPRCLRNFSLCSALLTLPLNFGDPQATVIFLGSICLIRVSHMDADNLSSARRAGLCVFGLMWWVTRNHCQMNQCPTRLLMTRRTLIYDLNCLTFVWFNIISLFLIFHILCSTFYFEKKLG